MNEIESIIPRQNHVILLRHCVRSTKSKVKLNLIDSSATRPISEFTKSPLPNWNVPSDWCTEDAVKTIKNSGSYLMREVLHKKDELYTRKKKIKFNVIADTAYRDVDTALSLTLGIAEGAKELTDYVETIGLNNLRYDHYLFKPFDFVKRKSKSKYPNSLEKPICDPNFSVKDKAKEVVHRFHTIPRPKSDLNETLTLLENLAGVGSAGPLASLTNNPELSVNDIQLYRDEDFEGPINVLKLMAQMMFYSRAGGIKPSFLPKATVEDVYNMLAWAHYSRSVISVDNRKIALKGAILADTVIRELQRRNQSNNKDSDDAYDVKVTILVGHDTDIDSLATALGLRWRLSPPFYQDDFGEFVATPPGSAMHFVHDIDSSEVKMSYLYPIMVTGKSKGYHLNRTGILESAPMTFRKGIDENFAYKLVQDNAASYVSSVENNLNGVDVLNARAEAVLKRYPEAAECFSNVTSQHHDTIMMVRDPFCNNASCWIGFSFVSLIVVSILVIFTNSRRIKKIVESTVTDNWLANEQAKVLVEKKEGEKNDWVSTP